MALSPFAFDPPTGWADASVFPTYEASEVKVRADMQKLHNQARDFINGIVTEINEGLLTVDISSFSSLPKTIYSSKITDDHEVLNVEVGTPDAQASDWTITTEDGYVAIDGDIDGSTTLKIVLGKSQATV